jgi:uncharacterized protein with FMN-binding domain
VFFVLAGTVVGTAMLVAAKGPAPADTSTDAGVVEDPGTEDSVGVDCPSPSAEPRPGPSGKPAASAGPVASPAARRHVFAGPVVTHRWGPVQVQITMVDDRIVDVTDLQRPSHPGEGVRINAHALPILRSEVLDAQSADIDTVSGATLTSEAYRESLQAALDEAAIEAGC